MNKSTITTSIFGFAVVAALITGCSAPDPIPTAPTKTTAAAPTETLAPAAGPPQTGTSSTPLDEAILEAGTSSG